MAVKTEIDKTEIDSQNKPVTERRTILYSAAARDDGRCQW